jgi:single-stranded-DNA-specific exonuclease
VISVDNGTSRATTIAELARIGVDTIVTDHHEPPQGELPRAVALVNPKLADSRYPFRELCGARRRVQARLGRLRRRSPARAACARICASSCRRDGLRRDRHGVRRGAVDRRERVLARRGLAALESTSNVGLKALLGACVSPAGVWRPRTSATSSARASTRPDGSTARRARSSYCSALRSRRRASSHSSSKRSTDERRRVEAELCTLAYAQAQSFADVDEHPLLVLAGEGWHAGVVGIVAARVTTRFHRPSLVIGLDGERGRGSARSIDGFDVLEAMHGAREHFVRYGGHAQAAGCEIERGAVDAARRAMCAKAREMLAGSTREVRTLWIDAKLPLGAVTEDTMKQLERLEPFGQGNEKPVLLSNDVRLAEAPRVLGEDRSHLMLRLRQGEHVLKAMAFGMASRASELSMGTPLHVVHTPRWNEFRGERNLELVLHDFGVGAAPRL